MNVLKLQNVSCVAVNGGTEISQISLRIRIFGGTIPLIDYLFFLLCRDRLPWNLIDQ